MKKRMHFDELKKVSPRLWGLNQAEEKRQQETLALIPSENYASRAVRQASASVFTNKYSEGYPGKRYYPGNEMVDAMELEVQRLALEVFGLDPAVWHVNVQTLSGSPANLAVYKALMENGETFIGMLLAHGGHLTHGHTVSVTGKDFRCMQYGLAVQTEFIDYDQIRALAREHHPKIIVSGATAYPCIIDFKAFREIADEVGAYHMVDMAHIAGLIAAGAHPSPFPYADIVTTTTHKTLRGPRGAMIFSRKDRMRNKEGKERSIADLIDRAVFPGLQGGPHNHTTLSIGVALEEALRPSFKEYGRQVVANAKTLAQELLGHGFRLVSGGTENHLLLVDLKNKIISDEQIKTEGIAIPPKEDSVGRRVQELFEKAGLIANRNSVPGDQSPFRPSGIRMGTPAVTTRGMKEKEMRQLARWIHELIDEKRSSEEIRKELRELCAQFPVP